MSLKTEDVNEVPSSAPTEPKRVVIRCSAKYECEGESLCGRFFEEHGVEFPEKDFQYHVRGLAEPQDRFWHLILDINSQTRPDWTNATGEYQVFKAKKKNGVFHFTRLNRAACQYARARGRSYEWGPERLPNYQWGGKHFMCLIPTQPEWADYGSDAPSRKVHLKLPSGEVVLLNKDTGYWVSLNSDSDEAGGDSPLQTRQGPRAPTSASSKESLSCDITPP